MEKEVSERLCTERYEDEWNRKEDIGRGMEEE